MPEVFIPDHQAQNGSAYMDRLEGGIRRGDNFSEIKESLKVMEQAGMYSEEGVKYALELKKQGYADRQKQAREHWRGVRVDKKSTMRPLLTMDMHTWAMNCRQDPFFFEDKKNIENLRKESSELFVDDLIELY